MEVQFAEEVLVINPPINQAAVQTEEKRVVTPLLDCVADEAGEKFARYLDSWGFFIQPNVIFLSSVHHYFYNPEEIEKVQTIINLKQVNKTKQVAYFLRTMNRILPLKGYYVGSFFDYKNQREKALRSNPSVYGYFSFLWFSFLNRFLNKIPVINRIQYFLNQKKIKCWTSDEIDHLLDIAGFKTLDIKEINGKSYFIAEKVKQTRNENISFHKYVNTHKTKSRLIDS